MQAIQMDQGHSSVLNFIMSSRILATTPEPTVELTADCSSCGVDKDRILAYEVVTEDEFRNRSSERKNRPNKGDWATLTSSYGVTSKCTPSIYKNRVTEVGANIDLPCRDKTSAFEGLSPAELEFKNSRLNLN